MKTGRRWWNDGRYERECAAFDAEQPLSSEVWKSLLRYETAWLAPLEFEPIRESDPDIEIRWRMSPVITYPNLGAFCV